MDDQGTPGRTAFGPCHSASGLRYQYRYKERAFDIGREEAIVPGGKRRGGAASDNGDLKGATCKVGPPYA